MTIQFAKRLTQEIFYECSGRYPCSHVSALVMYDRMFSKVNPLFEALTPSKVHETWAVTEAMGRGA